MARESHRLHVAAKNNHVREKFFFARRIRLAVRAIHRAINKSTLRRRASVREKTA
jgi:hypothetical protein